MAKFKLELLETKSPEWKIASVTDDAGLRIDDVSINSKDRSGVPFPNFETMMTGHFIEGEFWRNPSGKAYIFPPKPQATQGGANRGSGAINKAMDRKEHGIEKTMDRKEEGIMTSSTIRMAVDIALAEVGKDMFDVGVFKGRIHFWRDWLVENWDLK